MSKKLQSFVEVFDRHFDDVYRYVAYRLAPDRDLARDVTQDVFLAAIRGWPSFRGEGSVLAWLRGIARRKVADELSARGKRAKAFTGEVAADLPAEPQNEREERAQWLAAAMARLPQADVEALEEKYLEGMSVREIALKHGRSEKAVESALSRARAHLRHEYCRQSTNR